MEAVYERALGSRGGSRVSYLDRLEADAGGQPIAVDVLVDAFLSSALRLTRKDSIPGRSSSSSSAGPSTSPARHRGLLPAEYREAVDRYRQAFMRTLPHLSQDDVVWRMYFFVGIVAYAMAGKDVMRMTETYALADAGSRKPSWRACALCRGGLLAAPEAFHRLATPDFQACCIHGKHCAKI
jgi:hypothetical protein